MRAEKFGIYLRRIHPVEANRSDPCALAALELTLVFFDWTADNAPSAENTPTLPPLTVCASLETFALQEH